MNKPQGSFGALNGIKILELGRVPPAELPGMIFSDMGAEVLKIDTPVTKAPSSESKRAAVYAYTNRNKRSMTLNLKAPEGIAIFRRLADSVDVIVEGFRPGVMQRLGVDYKTVCRTNPRLVYCSISGFGQNGPYRDYPAHDLNFIAMAGVLGLIGEPDRMPAIPLNLVADYGGASMHAALGIMLALFARERTGRGQYVDISYLDATIALLAATPAVRHLFSDGHASPRGGGITGGSYPNYTIYETRDNKLITIACSEPKLWENFCRAIDRPEFSVFARKPEHYLRPANAQEAAAREEIAKIMKTRERDEWYDILTKLDVCAGKVYELEEMIRDPQVAHREMVTDLQHPEFGSVRQFGPAIKLSETPAQIRSAAPIPGQHTEEVLRAIGLSAADVASLREGGVI